MLTIDFDPRHPVHALESCAAIAEMLGDYITFRRQDCEMPDMAAAGVGMLCDAIAAAQHRVITAIAEASKPAVVPQAAAKMPIAERFAEAAGVSIEQAEKMIADAASHIKATRLDAERQRPADPFAEAVAEGKAGLLAAVKGAPAPRLDAHQRQAEAERFLSVAEVADACKAPAPRLTEPRPAAAKRRRAA